MDCKNLKKLSDGYVKRILKNMHEEAHQFKRDVIGNGDIDLFDIHRSTVDGELWVVKKDGKVCHPSGLYHNE